MATNDELEKLWKYGDSAGFVDGLLGRITRLDGLVDTLQDQCDERERRIEALEREQKRLQNHNEAHFERIESLGRGVEALEAENEGAKHV